MSLNRTYQLGTYEGRPTIIVPHPLPPFSVWRDVMRLAGQSIGEPRAAGSVEIFIFGIAGNAAKAERVLQGALYERRD